jgi:HSP20 family protein
MRHPKLSSWMWGDALSLLEEADRLHRRFSQCPPGDSHCWEPPVDVTESEDAVTIYVALPGVPREAVIVTFTPAGVSISGVRRLPASRTTRIHRIEIPYGRFKRTIRFPLQALEPCLPEMADGCLVLTLKKVKELS